MVFFKRRTQIALVASTSLSMVAGFSDLSAQSAPVILPDGYEKQPPNLFLERAYFSFASPTSKNLLFEGKPAVHYYLFNQFSDKVWQKGELRNGWGFAFPVSALFEVRMLDTLSEPVRTPSYRIRPIHLQAVRMTRYKDPLDYRLVGLYFAAAHYSNGQQGCTYEGQSRTDKGDCASTANASVFPSRNNRLDGDFSTSYLSAGVNVRHGRLFDTSEPMKWQITSNAEIQIHPIGLPPGGMNLQQARTFGQHQWSARLDAERRLTRKRIALGPDLPQGVFRATVESENRFGGKADRILRRSSFEMAYTLDRASHAGVFVRQNWGFDYYNIWYDQQRPFFSAGFIWDVGRLDLLPVR
jgi:hypothetical protein